ncbi:hypothetical protein FE391_45760 [Nonomuraea sp. KC401]|uniref:hypothetical protein n=1 Tax=unclassified Nonomuraea TaxID=2593643 RepID=UPI0010FDF711|nr:MULTISPECIES: hypothetical protein [unclassified Nonomuraea]NBE95584.1 hypothetical protein [Nonomuraea sp. K271]TLF48215.1 hypothetical protein FE391_45760 [Nonomuraea sp. KC401]
MNADQKGSGTGSRDTARAGRAGLRGLRAAVFAVVSVFAALGMHVLAGGPDARLVTVVAATLVTGAGAYVLARRQRSLGTLLAASFAAQYGMHQLFGSGAAAFPGHHGGGLHTGTELGPGTGMVLAHVLVAAVSAWWLRRGETALLALASLLACSLRGLWDRLTTRLAPTPAPRPGLVPAAPGDVAVPPVLAWTLCRRGPPR